MEKRRIVFVCHSTGGIVVRYMLESRFAQFADKDIGLLLIASPSRGSALATRQKFLSDYFGNGLAAQWQSGNDSLDELDERFWRLIREQRIRRLIGMEAYERHFVIYNKFLSAKSKVVPKESAERYFPPRGCCPIRTTFPVSSRMVRGIPPTCCLSTSAPASALASRRRCSGRSRGLGKRSRSCAAIWIFWTT